MRKSRSLKAIALLSASCLLLAACGSSKSSSSSPAKSSVTVIASESFIISKNLIDDFTKETGVDVKILAQGGAGENLNQAILTKGHPAGDVITGVDNSTMTKALDAGILTSFHSDRLNMVPDEFELDSTHRLTPVDHANVCVAYDKKYFTDKNTAAPTSFEDLIKPEYKGLVVTENAQSETTGLAFLLASVKHFGEGGWQQYWRSLQANNVQVAAGWTEAFNTDFSAGPGKGEKPIVVSYATDPASDVAAAPDPKPSVSNIGIIDSTCFEQIEFAGILTGTQHKEAAQKFIDFLLSRPTQEDVPVNMYVYPVVTDATLPKTFADFAQPIASPIRMSPAEIGNNRERWAQEWSSIVK